MTFRSWVVDIGYSLRCVKEKENEYDDEAIRVEDLRLGKVGYVANSIETKAIGTYSAGRLYDLIEDEAFIEVKYIYHNMIICQLIEERI